MAAEPDNPDTPVPADLTGAAPPPRARPRTQAEINESLLSVDHLKHGIGARTARGGAIVMASQLVRIVMQLAATFVLARLLAPEDFGIIAAAMTVTTFLALFTELGLVTVTVQARTISHDTVSALLYINVLLMLAAGAVAALLSPLIAELFDDPRIPMVVVGLALIGPFNALGTQHYAIMERNMMWMETQVIGVIGLGAGILAAVLCAWLTDIGYWALVVQAHVQAVVSMVAVWIRCPWRPGLVRDWSGVWKALRTSLNLSGTMALQYLHRQVDVMLIGWRWGATELGYYARAYSLIMLPMSLVSGPLTKAVIPALSRLQDDPEKWRRAFLDALISVTAVSGVITALMFGSAETLTRIVLGPGWERADDVFTNLVLAMFAATPMGAASWIWISLGRTGRMIQWGVFATAIYLAAFWIGLPGGAPGVALAYGCAQMALLAPCLWAATRGTSVSFFDVIKAAGPLLLATALVGAGLRFATTHAGLLLDIVATGVAGFVYFALIAAIGWRWPPHARVRDRALRVIDHLLARAGLQLRFTPN